MITGVATACVIDLLLGDDADNGQPVDWFRIGIALSGLTVRGLVRFGPEGTNADDPAGFSAIPIVLTLTLAVVVFWVTRRLGRSLEEGPEKRSAQIGVGAGLLFAALHSVLLLVGSEDTQTGIAVVHLSPFSWQGLLGGTVLVGLGAWLGAVAADAQAAGVSGWRARMSGPALNSFLHALTQVLALVAVAAAVVLIAFLTEINDPFGEMTHARFWVALVLAVPTVVLAAAGLISGATLDDHSGSTFDGFLDPGSGMLAGGAPGELLLGLVGIAVVSVLVGIRFALREPPKVGLLQRAWIAPAFSVLLWLGVSQMARISSTFPGSTDTDGGIFSAPYADVSAGISSLVALGVLWTFLGLLGGRLLVRPVAAAFPRMSRRLAGGQGDEGWTTLLSERLSAGRSAQQTILGRGKPTLILALIFIPACALLVLLPSDGLAGCGNAVTAAMKSDRTPPSTTPPAAIRDNWTAQQAKVDQAQTAADKAVRRAGPGRAALAGVTDLRGQLSSAETQLSEDRATLSEAQDEVDYASDPVQVAQDDVDVAQSYYDEFSDYDYDGFWLGELNDAKASLAQAQADMNAANQARAEAQAAVDATQARVTDLEDRIANLDATVSANQGALYAAENATAAAERVTRELADDRNDWTTANQKARTETFAFNRAASECRTNGRVRTAPALLGLLILAGFATGQFIRGERGATSGVNEPPPQPRVRRLRRRRDARGRDSR